MTHGETKKRATIQLTIKRARGSVAVRSQVRAGTTTTISNMQKARHDAV